MARPRGAERAAAEQIAAAARRWTARLRRVAAGVALLLAVAAGIDYAAHAPTLTIPRIHRMAQCEPSAEEYKGDLLMCKGAEAHNSKLLNEILEKGREGLLFTEDAERWMEGGGGSSIATAIVQYYTALSMRSSQLFYIDKVVHDFLMHSFKNLACTRLVAVSETVGDDDSFLTPPFLCIEAVFARKATGDLKRFQPTELMLTVQRMALLFCLFGSEFHEGTVIYSMVLKYEKGKADTHNRPMFGYDATIKSVSLGRTEELLVRVDDIYLGNAEEGPAHLGSNHRPNHRQLPQDGCPTTHRADYVERDFPPTSEEIRSSVVLEGH